MFTLVLVAVSACLFGEMLGLLLVPDVIEDDDDGLAFLSEVTLALGWLESLWGVTIASSSSGK